MAIRNRVYIITRWVLRGNTHEPEILATLPVGLTISDVTGQPDENIPPTPNVYIAFVEGLTAAQLTILQADTRMKVLSAETYDEATERVISSDRSSQPLDAVQSVTKTDIKTRFSDVRDSHLAAFRSGRSTGEIVDALRANLRELPRGGK